MTDAKIVSCVLIVLTLFFSAVPVTGSMLFRVSSVTCDDDIHTGDIIDPNMAFLILPEELSVKVNDTFAIQIGVENVTDMYGWQVGLRFDHRVLECVNVYHPLDHVFSYALSVGAALVEYNATEFTNPLYMILNDQGRMLAGNCLLGTNQSTFNGSGTLCQMEFRAISTGKSIIKLCLHSGYDSFTLNSEIRGVKPPSTVECIVICR